MVMKDSEKYKSPATEGYVDSKDSWYFHRVENLMAEQAKKTKEYTERECTKTSELAKESALVSVAVAVIVLLTHFYVLHKSR